MANESGVRQYVKPTLLRRGIREAARAFQDFDTRSSITNVEATIASSLSRRDQQHPIHAPKALRKAIEGNAQEQRHHAWSELREPPYELSLIPNRLELKWQADTMWYTDGSAMKANGAQRIGAGFYNANANVAKRVQCCAAGAINTITRAELCALYKCLEELMSDRDEVIATDSRAIMWMVNNGIDSLDYGSESKHKALVRAIAERIIIRARMQVRTTVVKVKSHSGIIGNDQADELAHAAAETPMDTDPNVNIPGGFQDCFWPTVLSEVKDNETRQNPNNEPARTASNLNIALKNAARPRFQTGLTNETQYVRIWRDIRGELDL